jgi:hypothetical protein
MTKKFFIQMSNGKIHARKNCSVTSRTRYAHGEIYLTQQDLANRPLCQKCMSA